jgi:hypothetical protein
MRDSLTLRSPLFTWMEAQGFTVITLHEASGVCDTSISKIINGHRKICAGLLDYLRAVGVSESEIGWMQDEQSVLMQRRELQKRGQKAA